MTDANESRYVYVIFIRTTPQALWTALTSEEFTRQYWFGMHQESDWTPGSSWRLVFADGRVGDTGEILECDPPRRLVIKWRNEFRPELKQEGYARCAIDLARSKLIEAVSGGWPRILSNLKSLLETGEPVFKTAP